jgi:catechol 2,3-dioxygenase-like lactoylglutathione lyase family enzyme
MTPQLEAFDHIHVYVADRPAAEAWFARVLGFARNKDLEFWAEGGGPLTIQNPSGSIHIALFERPSQPCRSTLALRATATEYRAWREHLRKVLEGQVTEEDHGASFSLYFRDPDGNPYEITTYDVQAVRA